MTFLAPALASADAAPPLDDEAAIHGTFNNGEDLTRPRNQFQGRERYQRLPDAKGLEPEKWTTTLRADLWAGLGDGWKLYGRSTACQAHVNKKLPLCTTFGTISSAALTRNAAPM